MLAFKKNGKEGFALITPNDVKKLFLFENLSDESIESLLSEISPQSATFSRGETVYSKTEDKKIGLILEGKCEVRHSRSDGSSVVINFLSDGDSFGVLSAFSDNEFPTEIVATISTKVVFFEKKDVIALINNHSDIAMNLINFLVNRIEFLNKKIVTFSGGSVEEKLTSYILSEAKQKGEIFDFNRKKAAEAISAGRASVYRALDSLVESGVIKYDSKKIYILDLKGLERISK